VPKVSVPNGEGRVSEQHHYKKIDLPQADDDERLPASDSDLGRAIKPAIEGVILETLKENPKVVINLVYPVLGKAIRMAISSALAGMAASIEKKATSAFKLEGLRWRWQAFRTKTPYAQIVMANSLVYEVEDVLLIHRGTGILLAHAAKDVQALRDHDVISSMLGAIEDFARDSLNKDETESLSNFTMGDTSMVVKSTPLAVVAASVNGTVTAEVHEILEKTTEEIHTQFHAELEKFEGGLNEFAGALPILESALKSEHSRKIPGQD